MTRLDEQPATPSVPSGGPDPSEATRQGEVEQGEVEQGEVEQGEVEQGEVEQDAAIPDPQARDVSRTRNRRPQRAKKPSDEHALDRIALIVSVISLAASVWAMYRTSGEHSDDLTSGIIRENYSDFISLHEVRAQYPLHSHLFALPEAYGPVRTQVVDAVCMHPADSREQRVRELVLQEGALARRIFSMYEHAFYQHKLALENGDTSRSRFLGEVLHYFTSRLLKNPRLAWYWQLSGAGYEKHYEQGTRELFIKAVLPVTVDAVGPFPMGAGGPVCKASPPAPPSAPPGTQKVAP